MRIAATYENNEIFQHFGRCGQFKLYDIEGHKVVHSTLINTNGSGHGALVEFLKRLGVDALVCGGIGGGAKTALEQAGIKLYGNVRGIADQAVEALLRGKLSFDSNVTCSHHDEEHKEGTCDHHDASCGHQGGSCSH